VDDFRRDPVFPRARQPLDQAKVGRLQGLGDRITLYRVQVRVPRRDWLDAQWSPAFQSSAQDLYMNRPV